MSGKYDPGDLVGTVEAAEVARRAPATIRAWAHRRVLVEVGRTAPTNLNPAGCPLYRVGDVLDAERKRREQDDTDRSTVAVRLHHPATRAEQFARTP